MASHQPRAMKDTTTTGPTWGNVI